MFFEFLKKLFSRKPVAASVSASSREAVSAPVCEAQSPARVPVTPELRDRLRAARAIAGLTQPQVAAVIGVTVKNVSDLEAGRVGRDLGDVAAKLIAIYQARGVWSHAEAGKAPPRIIYRRGSSYPPKAEISVKFRALIAESHMTLEEVCDLVGYPRSKRACLRAYLRGERGFPVAYVDKAMKLLASGGEDDLEDILQAQRQAIFDARASADTPESYKLTEARSSYLRSLRGTTPMQEVFDNTGVRMSFVENWESGAFAWGDRRCVRRVLDFYAVKLNVAPYIIRNKFESLGGDA